MVKNREATLTGNMKHFNCNKLLSLLKGKKKLALQTSSNAIDYNFLSSSFSLVLVIITFYFITSSNKILYKKSHRCTHNNNQLSFKSQHFLFRTARDCYHIIYLHHRTYARAEMFLFISLFTVFITSVVNNGR